MQGSIKSYIKSCDICQQIKVYNLKPTILLQPLTILDKFQGVVSMEFIIGLTPSTNGYDAKFVCVDELSQMANTRYC